MLSRVGLGDICFAVGGQWATVETDPDSTTAEHKQKATLTSFFEL